MQPSVYEAQKPLKAQYKDKPEYAMVVDHCKTSGEIASDPFHSTVKPMDGCGVSGDQSDWGPAPTPYPRH